MLISPKTGLPMQIAMTELSMYNNTKSNSSKTADKRVFKIVPDANH
jgi:hypothetical protein